MKQSKKTELKIIENSNNNLKENNIVVYKKDEQITDDFLNDDFLKKEKLKKALIKKATGYTQNEVVEEYVCADDGEIKLSKRKVTKKFVPPDIPAVKMLIEEFEQKTDYTALTEEELLKEKERLVKELLNL